MRHKDVPGEAGVTPAQVGGGINAGVVDLEQAEAGRTASREEVGDAVLDRWWWDVGASAAQGG